MIDKYNAGDAASGMQTPESQRQRSRRDHHHEEREGE